MFIKCFFNNLKKELHYLFGRPSLTFTSGRDKLWQRCNDVACRVGTGLGKPPSIPSLKDTFFFRDTLYIERSRRGPSLRKNEQFYLAISSTTLSGCIFRTLQVFLPRKGKTLLWRGCQGNDANIKRCPNLRSFFLLQFWDYISNTRNAVEGKV